jgi:predicted RNA binding protein YcfA (HicA-like mRNA interferase family)
MTQIDKLVAKFLANPLSVDFPDLDRILKYYWWEQKITNGGSHVHYFHEDKKDIITIPVHHNDCKPTYKRNIKKVLIS